MGVLTRMCRVLIAVAGFNLEDPAVSSLLVVVEAFPLLLSLGLSLLLDAGFLPGAMMDWRRNFFFRRWWFGVEWNGVGVSDQ